MSNSLNWQIAPESSGREDRPTEPGLEELASALEKMPERSTWFRAGDAQAVLVPIRVLQRLGGEPGVSLEMKGACLHRTDDALFVAAGEAELNTLLNGLVSGGFGIRWPAIIGISPEEETALASWARTTGRTARSVGRAQLHRSGYGLFEISRRAEKVSFRPPAVKIGESDENLDGRAEWFRQRAGK